MNILTLEILAGVTVALVGYDIFTILKFGVKSSISYNGYQICKANPILALALGIVIGHILWTNCSACG